MSEHVLKAGPETIVWGRFSAETPPVLTVASGDRVVVETLSGPPGLLPPDDSSMTVAPALHAIHAANLPIRFGHLLTGPIAIADAEPGDMLEVRIEAIEPGADWGFNAIVPFEGTLPDDFILPDLDLMHIPIDLEKKTCALPFGPELPLAPFFGVMGVAPPPVYGELSSREPRLHGGNLDNKDLGAGSTLFLPVFVPGANFLVGDGHGLQGHGEVCVTALETALTGTFTFVLHKKTGTEPRIGLPRAETPTAYMTMGFSADLDEAMRIAVREMLDLITERLGITRSEAYRLASLAADFHVTQTVNGQNGIHGLLPKSVIG
ncbi:acetamidase/formamidase family protein [Kaistia geumhonensis]|uniref:Acetamidase/formamidase n=1 Tax=Kaistia geumhonensis TaxID=410839 RepID=A0ABU0M2M5_9HYPH|nr:acetamidase/formamidase family protein [Kaistia geumhonensis]MCX5479573.1 acetamidase/formamidase family protein [Kaistia geumhonensis]MDQ0515204.1 acetamidase/formamidase [Kaistia geumhonensis]